ncbi:hypothetical protein [uncultured Paracoccus sp.]|uniref:COG4223 family protein n=1 Tax=uncultured Paracoccus sp. TaxID=189685 RepID=UPI0026164B34|nr:hypothetical protein [uncultured Paracoccus sp.]
MSSDKDPTGADDPNLAGDRREPAKRPVLEVRDAERIDAEPGAAEPSPMIESTLVGEGNGLPPAERKSTDHGGDAEEALARPTDAEPVDEAPQDEPPHDGDPLIGARPGAEAEGGSTDGVPTDDAGPGSARPDTLGAAVSRAAAAPVASGMPRVDRPAAGTQAGESEPVPDLNSPPVPAAAPPRRGGAGSMVLGGAIAAALGAGAAWMFIPQPPPDPPAPMAEPVDMAALTSQVQTESQAAVDAAAARLRDEAVAAATEAARAELAAQAEAIEARSTEAAAASARSAAEAAVQSAAAQAAAPQLDEAALRSLTEQAATAGADAARKIIAESPASDTPADLNATLSAQAEQLTALDDAIVALRDAIPQDLAGRLDQIPADLPARLEEQQAMLAELGDRPVLDQAQIDNLQQIADSVAETRTALESIREEARQELARVRDEAADLQTAAAEAARRARTAAAAATLSSSLTRSDGGDRQAALAQLQEAGVEVPPALTAEVVPLEQLQAEYDNAARAGLQAALRADPGSGGSTIGNFLRAQTGARSVTPREGSDPDAILSRAGDAVARGDINAALTEIARLPAPAQEAMAAWVAKANAWVAASSAVADLTAPAGPDDTAAASASPGRSADTAAAPAQPSN